MVLDAHLTKCQIRLRSVTLMSGISRWLHSLRECSIPLFLNRCLPMLVKFILETLGDCCLTDEVVVRSVSSSLSRQKHWRLNKLGMVFILIVANDRP